MSDRREDKIPDEIDIVRINRTLYMRITPKLREYLEIDENSTLKTQPEVGEFGRYISAWNPDQQEGGN